MTFYSPISTTAAAIADHDAYMSAYAKAAARAPHSYFDQHIIRTDDGCYRVADGGDYESLMADLVDRIVHTVTAGRSDEG